MSDVTLRNAVINPNGLKIREEGQAEVFAITVNEFENVSARTRLSFAWTIVPANFANGGTLLIVQCDSDTLILHIEEVIIQTDNSSAVQIHLTDRATLALTGGTLVTGVCWNQTAPRVAPAIARSNETANAQGNIIWDFPVAANEHIVAEMHGAVLLAKGQSLAVDITTAPTSLASCSIHGFFVIPDESRV